MSQNLFKMTKKISMEAYKALSYIFRLSTALAKDSTFFYHLGYLFRYRGEELILLLMYSRFNYKLSFYSILMSKYLVMSCFSIFSIHLHQHMLNLGLDSYYFEMLRHLILLQVLWPDISLHAPSHSNIPNTPKTITTDNPK